MSEESLATEISAIKSLQEISGFGPVRFREIHQEFRSFENFVGFINDCKEHPLKSSKMSHVRRILGKKILSKLLKEFQGITNNHGEFASHQLALAKRLNGHIISFDDERYPRRLYHTNQSVPLLYAIGDTALLNRRKSCAVVGTRNHSSWTRKETIRLVKKLVSEGYVIISGLAKGIDTISHQTTMEHNGSTIAVKGCGPDVYYPKENMLLQDEIKAKGLIISEYPFGSETKPLALKKRNKIIVGLSDFVCITETSATGGTMNSFLASMEQRKPIKIFLPISDVGGDFSGNLEIFKSNKAKVQRIQTGNEPGLSKIKKFKAIIFDLDGTLWDSRPAVLATMKSLLKEKGKDFTEKELEKKVDVLKSPYRVLKEFGIHRHARFWNVYEKNLLKVTLFSRKTRNIFMGLTDEGIRIGIVTSCRGKIARKLLQRFELDSFLSTIITPSETRARKPSPIPIQKALSQMSKQANEAICIGDENKDIQAAHRAGCSSGLAAWNKSEKTHDRADFVFAEIEDINLIRGSTRCTTFIE